MGAGDNIKKNTQAQKEFNAAAQDGLNTFRDYSDILTSISGELGKQKSLTSQAKKEYDSLVSISKKLAQQEEDITRLNDKQLEDLGKKAQANLAEIKALAAKVVLSNKMSAAEEALYFARESGFEIEVDTINKIKEEIALRAKSNEILGVAGGLLKGLNNIAGPFSSALKLDKVQKDMEAVADEAARTGDELGKIKVLGAGISGAFSSLTSTLTDPSVILGSIVKSFGELGKAQRDFRKTSGQNADNFSNMNDSLATSTDLIKASSMLSKELGVNANVIFGPEAVLEVAELTEFMGMGAHEAANLAKFAKLSGQELSTVTANMEDNFKSFVKTNAVGINIGDVMKDVGSASAAVTLSLGSQPEKIQAAAMEARKLGLSLEQVDKIAGSLLDFESSIQAEMEAEMLTGQQLNLDKARQLALANDLEGVAKEIGKNEGILKAFSSGNRIQQEATAKAMGMSREEMAKMIYQQKLQSGLTAEQAAKAADISLDEAKRLSTQEQISKALEKMSQAAAGILDIFAPILSNSVVLFGVVTSIGVIMTAKILSSLKGSVAEMKGLVSGAKDFLMQTGLIDKAKGLFSSKPKQGGIPFMSAMDKAKPTGPIGPVNKVGDAMGGLTKGTKDIKSESGTMIQSFLEGIGKGLSSLGNAMKSLGPTGLGYLAAGMAIFTLSIMGLGAALGFAAPGIKAFGSVITAVFAGFGTVIAAVAEGFVLIMENMTMEKIQPMFLLGPALLSISFGLAAMAISGLAALPIIGALGILALAAPALIGLAGIFGGGGDSGGDSEKEDPILKKLDEIITLIAAGGDVLIDGNKAGQLINLAGNGMGR